jgi:hypothetical protein
VQASEGQEKSLCNEAKAAKGRKKEDDEIGEKSPKKYFKQLIELTISRG